MSWTICPYTSIDEQNAVFCSRFLCPVNRPDSKIFSASALMLPMSNSLFDKSGHRKYLVARERSAFVAAAVDAGGDIATFCLTLAITGARISEVLALTQNRIDMSNQAIVFETLKQRGKVVFRAVPAPRSLLMLLIPTQDNGIRLWPWGRTRAWKVVKAVMRNAGIAEGLCKPKALRHAFAVEAGQKGVPLNMIQRWLGHARLETTAIYANAMGSEERHLARLTWKSLEQTISQR